MFLLLILLLIISAYTLPSLEWFLIGIITLIIAVIIIYTRFRKDKVIIIFVIIIFVLFLIYRLLDLKTFQSFKPYVGIVIRKSSNYIIVSDGIERLYLQVDEEVNLFSIIRVEGYVQNITSHPLESAFDFSSYLSNLGIKRQIIAAKVDYFFKFPISLTKYREAILSQIESSEAKTLVNLFLFHKQDYSSEIYKANFVNNIVSIFAISGLYVGAIINRINKYFSERDKQVCGRIISVFFVLPLLLLNITSLALIRILFYNILMVFSKLYEKKTTIVDLDGNKTRLAGCIEISSFNVKIFTFILLLLDKHNITNLSFIIPLLITLFLHFTKNIFPYGLLGKKVYPPILVFFILLPFIISSSNTFNVLNILSNFVILPGICVVFVLILPLLIFIKLPFLENILGFVYRLFSTVNLKNININVPSFNQFSYLFYYLLVFFFLYFKEINFRKFYRTIFYVFALFLSLYIVPINSLISSEIDFINIGQGDSTLIRVGTTTYLIDTGGDINNDLAINSLIPYFRKNRIYKIDYVFITHYDVDHYYALNSLKKYFIVKGVFDYNNISTYAGPLKIENLNTYAEEATDENGKSLVLRFELKDTIYLIMGDADINVESKILRDGKDVDVDVLKVGHHGSKTSSSYEFLVKSSPKEAIISCGYNNRYHHPSDEVVERLTSLGAKIRRTDLEGTIKYKFWF